MSPRILTGDTPTGRLHLGHYVGSLENRIRLQHEHESFILVANVHAFTTRADLPLDIRRDTIEIVRDQLAAGIDPACTTFVVQSAIPAIAELTILFAMLVPYTRVMRNPTLHDEIVTKGLGDRYSFGFPLYAVGQCADILAFRAHLVPVGEDQLAHLELCRDVARKFAQYDPALFPIPEPLVGRIGRLPGLDGVEKMSKSRGNAIFLSDSREEIHARMARLYTGRQSITEPGNPKNALFQYARAFMPAARVDELADRYERGDSISDAEIKREVANAIDALVEPMRARRVAFTDDDIIAILRDHAIRANVIANETLARVRSAMHLF